MKKTKTLLILSTLSSLILSASSQAGQRSGSGGDAVVCRDSQGKITRAEVFDYFEARMLRQITPSLGAPELPYLAKIELVTGRLRKHDPARADRYLEQARGFEANAQFLRGVALKDIQDSQEEILPLPRGCALEQAVIRRDPKMLRKGERKYLVDGEIWDAFSGDNQAGIVLHELAYEDSDSYEPQGSSRNARYFNAILSSGGTERFSGLDYPNFLSEVDFQQPREGTWQVNGMKLRARETHPRLEKGQIASDLAEPFTYQSPIGTIVMHDRIVLSRADLSIIQGYTRTTARLQTLHGEVEVKGQFDLSNGKLTGGTLAREAELVSSLGKIPTIGAISFYRSGALAEAVLSRDTVLRISGMELQAREGLPIQFHENGQIKRISFNNGPVLLPLPHLNNVMICGAVEFHANGQVARAVPCTVGLPGFSDRPTVEVQGKAIEVLTDSEFAETPCLKFHPNGQVKEVCMIEGKVTLKTQAGLEQEVFRGIMGTHLYLDEEGYLLERYRYLP